jgi:hypothetical protein
MSTDPPARSPRGHYKRQFLNFSLSAACYLFPPGQAVVCPLLLLAPWPSPDPDLFPMGAATVLPQLTCSFISNQLLAHSLLIALMREAVRTSETLVNLYQSTCCHNPEDSHLLTYLNYFSTQCIWQLLNLRHLARKSNKITHHTSTERIISIPQACVYWKTALDQVQFQYSNSQNPHQLDLVLTAVHPEYSQIPACTYF